MVDSFKPLTLNSSFQNNFQNNNGTIGKNNSSSLTMALYQYDYNIKAAAKFKNNSSNNNNIFNSSLNGNDIMGPGYNNLNNKFLNQQLIMQSQSNPVLSQQNNNNHILSPPPPPPVSNRPEKTKSIVSIQIFSYTFSISR